MPDMNDWNNWNNCVITEFRAGEGRVGGNLEGTPMVLVPSPRLQMRPGVRQSAGVPAERERRSIYVFAAEGGAPTHPDWYHHLVAAGEATIEVASSTYPVTVSELTGADRDTVYAKQVRRLPGFGEYAQQTEGTRTIPVLELRRR